MDLFMSVKNDFPFTSSIVKELKKCWESFQEPPTPTSVALIGIPNIFDEMPNSSFTEEFELTDDDLNYVKCAIIRLYDLIGFRYIENDQWEMVTADDNSLWHKFQKTGKEILDEYRIYSMWECYRISL